MEQRLTRFRIHVSVLAVITITLLLAGCTQTAETGGPTLKTKLGRHVNHQQRSRSPSWHIGWRADFWDSMADLCAGLEQAAADLVAANGSSDFNAAADVEGMAGHHYISSGTRVALLGHDTRMCSHSAMTATHILVQDRSSPLNQKDGYIASGFLKRY